MIVLNSNGLATPVEQVRTIDSTDILYISDNFLDKELTHVLVTKGHPAYIVSDLLTSHLSSEIKIYCLPKATSNLLTEMLPSLIIPKLEDLKTDYCFNFIINKPTLNRFILLKLVEWFQLVENARYTWSGAGYVRDISDILNEFNSLTESQQQDYDLLRRFLTSPIKLNPQWINVIGANNKRSGEKKQNFINAPGSIAQVWNSGVDNVFFRSGVSVIGESVDSQYGAVFTEKTHYSVLALTFPIWIGGKGQAHAWKNIGFDTFDDVINHSYQWHNTLIERCYHAIADNLHLLQNLDHVRNLRNQHADRLLHNRELLLSGRLQKYCIDELEKFPDILKQIWIPYVKKAWPIAYTEWL